MVRHLHQGFLPEKAESIGKEFDTPVSSASLELVRPCFEALVDTSASYIRKVSLSYLDEHIGTQSEWRCFCDSLRGVTCLYLIDDRVTINPVMDESAKYKTRQYIRQLAIDGIPSKVASLRRQNNDEN